MNKKTIILIAGITITILLIGFVLIFNKQGDAPKENGGFLGFFPTGGDRNIVISPPPVLNNGANDDGNLQGKALVLNRISSAPVACAGFFDNNISYIERQTGNIYKTSLDGKDKTRISNTTIPKVFDCLWSESGDSFVLQYFSDTNGEVVVRNFSAKLSGADEESIVTDPLSIEGVFLPQNTLAVVASPLVEKLFYFYKEGSEVVGIIANFQNKKQDQIVSSPFASWNISWPQERKIILETKPSGMMEGFLYTLDPKTEKMEKILGEIKGLTALWGFADEILYSETSGNSIKTWLYNTETGEKKSFQFNTLPEKCVFSSEKFLYCAVPSALPAAIYPDEWYQGVVSFSDQLWKVDIDEGTTELMLGNKYDFDIINLFLSDTEDYLFFTNKKDSLLWSVKLSE